MKVPLFDLKRVIEPDKSNLLREADRVISAANFIMGPDVSSFEASFANSVGASYCLGVSSGTDALLAIFMALDLPPGSEVIVPSFTFIASATAIQRAGYKPVFVDVGEDSFVTNLSEIKKVWTKNTRAVLFVHLFGQYSDLSGIKRYCDSNGAYLIEDCAQSYGVKPGMQGSAAAYSFFPAKNLGCLGDGGAVATNEFGLFSKIDLIRKHGSRIKYTYECMGGNFRLDTIQAAFLNVLINRIDEWIGKRRANSKFYADSLAGIGGLRLPQGDGDHTWNQYTLRTSSRGELQKHLSDSGIGSAVYYPNPIHTSELFGSNSYLPNTEKLCKEVLSIPVYPGLTENEREYVSLRIKEFFK